LLSAASVLNAIDKNKYDVVPIGMTKEGRWLTDGAAERLLQGKPPEEARHFRAGDPEVTPGAAVLAKGEAVVVPPEPVHRQGGGLVPFEGPALARRATDRAINVDVIFPVLHGTFGGAGTVYPGRGQVRQQDRRGRGRGRKEAESSRNRMLGAGQ